MSPLRSRDVIELGIRLVAQLDRKDDLLASWMAHYIAELMENVKKATPETKAAAEDVCAKAILELWRHRASLPDDVRPFARLDAIVRTLASLDPEGPSLRYYARERHDAQAEADEQTRKWLDFASYIDESARFLIRTAIRSAAARSAASMAPWVELAQSLRFDQSIEERVLQFVVNADKGGDEAQVHEAGLRLSLSKIESFLKAGAAFADQVRAHLLDKNDDDIESEDEEAIEQDVANDEYNDGGDQ